MSNMHLISGSAENGISDEMIHEADGGELSYHQLFYFSEWTFKFVGVTFDYLLEELDIAAFRTAVLRLVERHEILRTVFINQNGRIKQKLLPVADFNLEFREHHPAVTDEEMTQIVYREKTRIFDLAVPCFFFVGIYRVGKKGYKILITLHHALSDSYSAGVFKNELLQLYAAALGKRIPALKPLAIQYNDFSNWQKIFVQTQEGIRHKEYWLKRLKGFVPVLKFPPHGDAGASTANPDTCIYITSVIEGKLYEELSGYLKKNGLTRAVLLMFTLSLLINQLSGQDDITFFVPFSGRDSKYYNELDFRGLIGCFVSALFIRNNIQKDGLVIDHLKEIQDNFMEDLSFASYPLVKLLGELPDMPPARGMLESMVYYNYHNYGFLKETVYEIDELEKEGRKITILPGQGVLGLVVMEFRNCLQLSHRFRRDIFDEVRALEIKDLYFSILKRIIGNPQLSVKHFAVS